MRWVKALFLLLAIFVVIIFCVQNQSEVVLRFAFPWESHALFVVPSVPLPLFLVILCSIFLGVLIGGCGDIYQRFQLKKTLRRNQKKVEMLEREIQSLRGPGQGQSPSLNREG
jgi:uncharacterized integral membrane protein